MAMVVATYDKALSFILTSLITIRKLPALLTEEKSIATRCSISFMNTRNRTPLEYIGYGLYLCFLGLSFRKVAKTISFLQIIKRVMFPYGTGYKKYRLEIIYLIR